MASEGLWQINHEGIRQLKFGGQAVLSDIDEFCCCEKDVPGEGCPTGALDANGTPGSEGRGICEFCGPDFETALVPLTGPNYTPAQWWLETSGLTVCRCMRVIGDRDIEFDIQDGAGCAIVHRNAGCHWEPGAGDAGNLDRIHHRSSDGSCTSPPGDPPFKISRGISWEMFKDSPTTYRLRGVVSLPAPFGIIQEIDIFQGTAEANDPFTCTVVEFSNAYADLPQPQCQTQLDPGNWPVVGREGTVVVRRCCPPIDPRP